MKSINTQKYSTQIKEVIKKQIFTEFLGERNFVISFGSFASTVAAIYLALNSQRDFSLIPLIMSLIFITGNLTIMYLIILDLEFLRFISKYSKIIYMILFILFLFISHQFPSKFILLTEAISFSLVVYTIHLTSKFYHYILKNKYSELFRSNPHKNGPK